MMSRVEVYPDQTLPSVLAGAFGVGCVGSRRRAGGALTGFEGAVLSVDLPQHLTRIAAFLRPRIGYDAHELIARHTMLPVYAPWLEPARLEQIIDAMLGDGSTAPAALVATHACGLGLPPELRFCRQCRADEIGAHQCAWWHRAHQLWGRICPIHRVPLVRSQFPRRNAWRVDYPAVEDALDIAGQMVKPLDLDFSDELALLLAMPVRAYGKEALRTAYFELLAQAGFVSVRLRRADFLHAVAERYGSRYLAQAGLSFSANDPYSWPAKLVVSAGGSHSPFRHLHLIRFLGSSVSDFLQLAAAAESRLKPRERKGMPEEMRPVLRRLWANPELSLAEICRRLRVHDHTVRAWATALGLSMPRFGTEDRRRAFAERRSRMREIWLCLRDNAHDPQRPKTLKWLARNDAAWFARHRRSDLAQPQTRVDWATRDRALCRRVSGAASRVVRYFPFRRVCQTSIADVLHVRYQVARGHGRLPLFSEAVKQITEDARQFALRRIRMLRRRFPRAPRWRIRDLASIPRPLPADPEIRSALGYPLDYSFRCKSR